MSEENPKLTRIATRGVYLPGKRSKGGGCIIRGQSKTFCICPFSNVGTSFLQRIVEYF